MKELMVTLTLETVSNKDPHLFQLTYLMKIQTAKGRRGWIESSSCKHTDLLISCFDKSCYPFK